jgi:CheY-like chemotaxis protein
MERLLIVEDDEIGRMVLWELLSDQYDCDLAFNGEEAIEKLGADEYGHVLLDLMMPKVDGFGVMDYLRNSGRTPGPSVIVLTGDHREETKQKCLDAGAKAFLHKPYRLKDILSALAT